MGRKHATTLFVVLQAEGLGLAEHLWSTAAAFCKNITENRRRSGLSFSLGRWISPGFDRRKILVRTWDTIG